jgi:hypothetical protein
MDRGGDALDEEVRNVARQLDQIVVLDVEKRQTCRRARGLMVPLGAGGQHTRDG